VARRPERGIAELAIAAGYVDQPHLAKDCRALAGVTPRQLIELLPRTSVAATLIDVDAVRQTTSARPRRSAA
jgi:AraC-like DNA-binding protein